MIPLTHARPLGTVSVTRSCLALNASFEPLTILPVSRAIGLVLAHRAETIEADPERSLRSESQEMEYPAVIRLKRFVKVPRKLRRGVSNTVLFARDRYCCSFCGRHRSELRQREFLTREHLVPQVWFKENGGDPNTWDNVATACSTCNNAKGDLSLQQFEQMNGYKLRITPTEPHFVHLEWKVRTLTPLQRKYVEMFFGENVAQALA